MRYQLKEWGPGNAAPQNSKELFDMRHTKARNIIERAFAVLKMCWGILRCVSYYPIKTQIRLIMACFLLHNFIRREMPTDPIEAQLVSNVDYTANIPEVDGLDYVDHVEPSAEWTQFRDALANALWLDIQRFLFCLQLFVNRNYKLFLGCKSNSAACNLDCTHPFATVVMGRWTCSVRVQQSGTPEATTTSAQFMETMKEISSGLTKPFILKKCRWPPFRPV